MENHHVNKKITASLKQNYMQSPSQSQDESNTIGSSKSEKSSSAQDASASATPVKRVSFPDAVNSTGIKKAVMKRGTRNQTFRNSRVCNSAWLTVNALILIQFLFSFITLPTLIR